MSNNTAIVGRLSNIRPIDGADKIRYADVTVFGVTQAKVVIDLVPNDGDKVVYFTSNMCLNEDTILKEYPVLSTYLGRAGRVRTVKLRGVISDGLAVELEKFNKWVSSNSLDEGFEFLDLGKVNICKRYEPPIKQIQQEGGNKKDKKLKKINRLVEGQVHFHYDTDNLRRNAHLISRNDTVSISSKWHGSSFTVQNVLTKRILPLKDKIAKFFGVSVQEQTYDYIYTSRTVVKNANLSLGNHQHFYKFDLWTHIGEIYFKGKLNKGEAVFGEVVGFLPNGGAIQAKYPYGCMPGEMKIRVYRITETNIDGVTFELGWEQMLERCKELEVEPVETLYYGTLQNLTGLAEDWSPSSLVEYLEKKYLGKKRTDCNNMPDEGIVIRIDKLHQAKAFKLKDAAFILGESKAFEEGTQDIEEEN